MCGILGFSWEDSNLLKTLAKNLEHRGPDEEGYFVEKVSLGHKRLSIIDLVTGQQPMFNEDGNIVIVYNGELYNYQNLVNQLQDKHKFNTKSDTEVIIHAYEEWGTECLQKFVGGVYSFAIYDKRKQIFFIARDRLGEKPLYYMINEQGFSFASEMKSLPFLSRTIDPVAIQEYLAFYCVPAPLTIYQEAKKLEPGHFLIYDLSSKKLEITKYWDLKFGPYLTFSEDELKREILTRLKESVKERLVADVPLGILLSGGIDSSTITALASPMTNQLKTFSICFKENPAYNEMEYIDIVSKQFNTENKNYNFTFNDVIECFDNLVWIYDEPYGDSSMFPTYLVSKLARKDVKVALTGDGGDETFGGYMSYFYYKKLKTLKKVPFSRQIGKVLMKFRNMPLYHLGRDLGSSDFNDLFFVQESKFSQPELTQLLLNSQNMDLYHKHRLYWNPKFPIESLMISDQKTYLTDCLMPKADRASMAAGLELRAPFLNSGFVEFANSIPASLKLKGVTKYILKKAMRGILPDTILDRKKKGFGIPLKEWLSGDLVPLMEDLLLSEKFRQRGLLNQTYVEKLIKDHKKVDHTDKLWTLMCLEKWFRVYHDPKKG